MDNVEQFKKAAIGMGYDPKEVESFSNMVTTIGGPETTPVGSPTQLYSTQQEQLQSDAAYQVYKKTPENLRTIEQFQSLPVMAQKKLLDEGIGYPTVTKSILEAKQKKTTEVGVTVGQAKTIAEQYGNVQMRGPSEGNLARFLGGELEGGPFNIMGGISEIAKFVTGAGKLVGVGKDTAEALAYEQNRKMIAYNLASSLANQQGRAISNVDYENFYGQMPDIGDTDELAQAKMRNIMQQAGAVTGQTYEVPQIKPEKNVIQSIQESAKKFKAENQDNPVMLANKQFVDTARKLPIIGIIPNTMYGIKDLIADPAKFGEDFKQGFWTGAENATKGFQEFLDLTTQAITTIPDIYVTESVLHIPKELQDQEYLKRKSDFENNLGVFGKNFIFGTADALYKATTDPVGFATKDPVNALFLAAGAADVMNWAKAKGLIKEASSATIGETPPKGPSGPSGVGEKVTQLVEETGKKPKNFFSELKDSFFDESVAKDYVVRQGLDVDVTADLVKQKLKSDYYSALNDIERTQALKNGKNYIGKQIGDSYKTANFTNEMTLNDFTDTIKAQIDETPAVAKAIDNAISRSGVKNNILTPLDAWEIKKALWDEAEKYKGPSGNQRILVNLNKAAARVTDWLNNQFPSLADLNHQYDTQNTLIEMQPDVLQSRGYTMSKQGFLKGVVQTVQDYTNYLKQQTYKKSGGEVYPQTPIEKPPVMQVPTVPTAQPQYIMTPVSQIPAFQSSAISAEPTSFAVARQGLNPKMELIPKESLPTKPAPFETPLDMARRQAKKAPKAETKPAAKPQPLGKSSAFEAYTKELTKLQNDFNKGDIGEAYFNKAVQKLANKYKDKL